MSRCGMDVERNHITGVVFEIRRFAIHDGPGIRTTVFFKGCPLDCRWCHNPEGRGRDVENFRLRSTTAAASDGSKTAEIGAVMTVETIMREVMRDEVYYDESNGGVTFSGGEPMVQIDFLEAMLGACRQNGLHTAVDTCGHAPREDFERIYDATDLFLYDLKLIDRGAHVQYTGTSSELILANLSFLAGKGNKVVVRVPMIPDITDTSENLEAIAGFLTSLKTVRTIHLLPYNKLGEDKVERYHLARRRLDLTPQTQSAMEQKAATLRAHGYTVVVGG